MPHLAVCCHMLPHVKPALKSSRSFGKSDLKIHRICMVQDVTISHSAKYDYILLFLSRASGMRLYFIDLKENRRTTHYFGPA